MSIDYKQEQDDSGSDPELNNMIEEGKVFNVKL
jgi:hypothetical protein